MTDSSTALLNIPGLASGLRLQVHAERDKVISPRILADGIWEPFETSLIMTLLSPGGVFVDVGANIGYFSILAAAHVGRAGRVFAFEPHPDNFKLLRASIALNGFDEIVQPVCAGLAEADNEGRLFLAEENLGDHQIYAGAQARESCAIALLQGADYLRERTERIDVVKIDTQGSETHVVRGLLPLLSELMPGPHLLVELTPYSLREAGSSGRELVQLLAGLGQPLWIVDHIEHRLAACSAEELALWCDNVDATPGDRGFMNVLLGPAPQGVSLLG